MVGNVCRFEENLSGVSGRRIIGGAAAGKADFPRRVGDDRKAWRSGVDVAGASRRVRVARNPLVEALTTFRPFNYDFVIYRRRENRMSSASDRRGRFGGSDDN